MRDIVLKLGLKKHHIEPVLHNFLPERIKIFDELIKYMDVGHSKYLTKVAFSLNNKNFAYEVVRDNINLDTLKSYYDANWLVFDGYYKRSIIKRKDK